MQLKFLGEKDFYCSSLLDPETLEAHKATRKKQNLEISNIKFMTAPGKTNWEIKKLEETLIRKSHAKLRLATITVGTLVGRSARVTETVGKGGVDIVALQEVHYRNDGVKTLKGDGFEFILYWKGEVNTANRGVGLMAKHKLAKSVMNVIRISCKIFFLDLVLFEKVVTVISVYGHQSGKSEENKGRFYDNLSAEMQ